MAKRKKRLEKGIESLREQIEIHEEKLREALERKDYESVLYLQGEIRKFEREKEKKEKRLSKKKRKRND